MKKLSEKRKIAILGFGGTLSMTPDKETGALKPTRSIEEILALVPSLSEKANVIFEGLEKRDSTNIYPPHWTSLAYYIQKIHDEVDAVIITHGTDTMAYNASALSLALGPGLKIPIVFTGAQLPLADFGTDARFNLENSMKVVLQACEEKIAEVMIVFSDRVLRGNRAIKTSESKFPAFDSPAFPHLAIIDATGVHFIPNTRKADPKIPLEIKPHFQRGILTIEVVPGLEPDIIREILKSGKCQGLLLKSLGAGNIPSKDDYTLIPVILEAINIYKIPVLVSTKFVGGRTRMDMYEPGKQALEAGAIPTGDMTDVMAQVKFMWALAQGYKKPEELNKIINTDIVGEITV